MRSRSVFRLCLLLFVGAMGKSAQLGLHTWLPDAMEGPTPVSALIHAATMVTAGVYLIARTHVLFLLAPPVLTAVAVIGAVTLVVAGFSALTQRDIKRILAYSTISQIGYMFLALGVGAWSAAMFHFMTHAFFKALLFLAAGAVTLSLHHEHDIFRMGGLRQYVPVTFWTFLIGGASLAGFPLVTAGFYSKDLILLHAMEGARGSVLLWTAGLIGALLTAIYIFRLIFRVFFGPLTTHVEQRPGARIYVALLVLAVLSIAGGWVELPQTLGHFTPFSDFMQTALPAPADAHVPVDTELALQIVTGIVVLVGIVLSYWLFVRSPRTADALTATPTGATLYRWWLAGWGFDWLYDRLLVRPFVWVSRANKSDFIDAIYAGMARLAQLFHELLSETQTGRVRWYAASIAAGSLIIIALMVLG